MHIRYKRFPEDHWHDLDIGIDLIELMEEVYAEENHVIDSYTGDALIYIGDIGMNQIIINDELFTASHA